MKRDTVAFATDEHPKATTAEALAKLRPAFRRTAASPPATPAASTTARPRSSSPPPRRRRRPGLTPKARILGYAVAGVRPEVMGIGPIPAVEACWRGLGLTVDDFDVIELNEAFAAQALAVNQRPRAGP